MEIQPINNQAKILEVKPDLNIKQADFSDLITQPIKQLNANITASEQAVESYVLGEAGSVHDVVIAMEKAKMSLQLAVEVRNKLVDAYQDILRMQI